jgi:phosphomannomutase
VLSVLSNEVAEMSTLIRPLRRYSHSGEINFKYDDMGHLDSKIREVAEAFKTGRIDRLDGITIEFDDWWFNVRKSNTEPMLRLNLETRRPQMLDEKFRELKKVLGEPATGH